MPPIEKSTELTAGTPTGKNIAPTFSNPLGMKFVLIPAGEFMMGSNDGNDDEQPVHKVTISQPVSIQDQDSLWLAKMIVLCPGILSLGVYV